MMAPRTALLVLVAAIMFPCAFLAAAWPPGFPGLVIAGFALVCLTAAADAFLSRELLKSVDATMPGVVRLTKDRAGAIPVDVKNLGSRQLNLRLALALPDSFASSADVLEAASPGQARVHVQWPCTPRLRGRYAIDTVYFEVSSLFGLWAMRRRIEVASELRVYPNLMSERHDLAALFLNRGAFGIHAQRQMGKGREFEKLRDYIPGDSYEDIHWKATAKRGHPVTKMFQIERTQEVYVILDTSRLSARRAALPIIGDGSEQKTVMAPQLERFITAALVLGIAAERQGDLFGLLTFSDGIDRFIRAKGGKTHYSACRDALYTLEPRVVNPDFEEVATFIRTRLRRRALLVFLTNLDDPVLAESFDRAMQLLCRQHLILVNMITPPTVRPLFAAPDAAAIDDIYENLGGHMLWQSLREFERGLRRRGVNFALLPNERLSAELVSQYINVKQRQAL